MNRVALWILAQIFFLISAQAVPPVLNYAGQVAVNGEAFDGNGLFKLALVNADGTTTYWSNDGTSVDGSEPQASVTVPVNGGLYAVLLGNTAQQGMDAIDPAVFAQHIDAKLRVWFSDGVNGFQQLSHDRPFASVPYAFSAGTAQTANSAPIANGAVNLNILSEDLKTKINAPISRSRLSAEVKADINATIGMNRLSLEVTEKLEREGSTFDYETPVVGSIKAVPYGDAPPVGYSLYKKGIPKWKWVEKASISVPRYIADGAQVFEGKIYLVGGKGESGETNILERYDPVTDNWENLASMTSTRNGVASTFLDGKFHVSSSGVTSTAVYDPTTNLWVNGVALDRVINNAASITVDGKIYLMSHGFVYCFDPVSNQWTEKANMPDTRHGHKMVHFANRIWLIGGNKVDSPTDEVISYDLVNDSWSKEPKLNIATYWSMCWVAKDMIFLAGGSQQPDEIQVYSPRTRTWAFAGNLPELKVVADAVVLNNEVYIIGGGTNWDVFTDKVYAADLNAALNGVYDLYRKDGDAPVGTPVLQSEYADGSVTASKMANGAITTSKLSEQILKYLKPEITNQPQSSTIYAGQNASYSVTAEGKYLTYQWKKDGVDLTGETNATLNITDANATQHDGNYSVVVGNDFGSVESEEVALDVNTTLLNGLVGWWKFDETSGTVAYDSSGNGNHGTLTNGPTWTDGKIGGALNFDGENDYVNLGNVYNNLDDLTVSSWVHCSSIDNTKSYRTIIAKKYIFVVNVATDIMKYSTNFSNGSGWSGGASSVSTVSLNEWEFISVTRLEGMFSLFVNSSFEKSSSNNSIGSNNINTFIGNNSGTNYHFKGLIDDVHIYDRALSAEEVQALYNLGQ